MKKTTIVIAFLLLLWPKLAKAESVDLMGLPPLPEDTVLFEEEKAFGYRGKIGSFMLPPNKASAFFDKDVYYENEPDAKSIRMSYRKEETKQLSFCGGYIVVMADLSVCRTMTFMIKGKSGGEAFELGINDTVANKREDAVYSGSIYRYLPGGITKEWQEVKVPLSDFFGADLSRTYSFVFQFNENGKGTFWIDNLRFHTELLVDRESEINKKGYLLLDDFDHSLFNLLGRKANTYKNLPSVCTAELADKEKYGGARSLKLKFDKKSSGWCGYYTLLNEIDGAYYDLTPYKAVSFMVKGEKGGETFEIGMADKDWMIIGDSIKAGAIEKYLPGGVTAKWQEAVIPLSDFGALDFSSMGSFVINFHAIGEGVVYIDDLKFLKK